MQQHPGWREDPASIAFTEGCCWPECIRSASEPPKIPLCREHLIVAWRAVADEIRTTKFTTTPKPKLRGLGLVYFVKLGDRIKIGYTKDLEGRLSVVPHEELLAVVRGTMADEARCHAAFKHLRTRGEWFIAAPDLLAFIDGLPLLTA